jgi:hypothetical protein
MTPKIELPTINIELHQRTALDGDRVTRELTLVAYADNQLTVTTSEDWEYQRPLATVAVNRPIVLAGTIEEYRADVTRAAAIEAFKQNVPGVYKAPWGAIYGKYHGE